MRNYIQLSTGLVVSFNDTLNEHHKEHTVIDDVMIKFEGECTDVETFSFSNKDVICIWTIDMTK